MTTGLGISSADGRSDLRKSFSFPMFLGEDLLPYLTLAIGGALVVGTGMALVRPPPKPQDGSLDRAPLARSVLQILIGLIASVWAIATLLA
jgi:hypothetical protein